MVQEFIKSIEDTARAVVDDIHTALPGKILSFNAKRGYVSVKPYGKYITQDEIELDYPVITEVPVIFPYSSSTDTGIAFPVKKGDDCLVIISEVELDEWRSGAEAEGSLRFDLSSAVAIPGIMKRGGDLFAEASSENAVVVRSGKVKLSVSNAGITLCGDLKVEGNISYTGSMERA